MKTILRAFNDGNVCIYGLRGRGKDLLMSNVCIRRKKAYVSNVDYGGSYIPFNPNAFDCGRNSYRNFIEGNLNSYVYPYPDGTDLYISDVGVYFPSQYCNELNKDYKYFPTFFALSRHVGLANVYVNTQSLGRAWDKIREQCDKYILCNWCKVLFGKVVIQSVTLYDNYESAVNKLLPFSVKPPLFAKQETMMSLKLQKQTYECVHGKIQKKLIIYINKSNYNTRFFKEVLQP